MMSFSDTLNWLQHIAALICVLILSPFFSIKLCDHSFKFRAIHFHRLSLSLYGLEYSYGKTHSIAVPHLVVVLHLPSLFDFTCLTATLHNYTYIDPNHHITISTLQLSFSPFPAAPNTCISATLDDFRVRVAHSNTTPPWMQRLRANLITTVLNGMTIRADKFKTEIIFNTTNVQGPIVTVANDDEDQDLDAKQLHSQPGSYESGSGLPEDDREAIVTLTASHWHIKNFRNRLYKFGSLDAQLRRSWDPEADRGSFVLVAKNSSWVLDSEPHLPPPSKVKNDLLNKIDRIVSIGYPSLTQVYPLIYNDIHLA